MADENVIGNYRLVKCLLTGQMSQVWEVVESASHRHFAMKLLLPEKAREPEMRRLMQHEANVGRQLAHQNVIKILHVGKDKQLIRPDPQIVFAYDVSNLENGQLAK